VHAREHLLRAYRGKDICDAPASLAAVLARRYDLALDVVATDNNMVVRFDALLGISGTAGAGEPTYVPVMFAHEEKISKQHKLSLAFSAAVLGRQQLGIPSFGRIIHGSCFRSTRVRLDTLFPDVEKALQELRSFEGSSHPPPLYLTTHCTGCMHSQSCRSIAAEKDDLSLLQGLKPKEIVKLKRRGIFTVTQLSYTFRPRKKSRRSKPNATKYYHALRALAIREKTIYIAGTPAMDFSGTPVYLDVEGVPDRDFYYLIGLRHPNGDSCIQRSFWADDSSQEETIWRQFLAIIATLERPQLLHYGRYETVFLRRMKSRYGGTTGSGAPIDILIGGAQNILSVIYGHIYFPTYSNGLKDLASSLGYRWSIPEPSGQHSLLLRREWELTNTIALKNALIAYNADDCAALELVVKAVLQVAHGGPALSSSMAPVDAVHVDSMKPKSPYALGPVEFALPELDHINRCAYWEYQRDRVYVRSSPRLRRAAQRQRRRKRQAVPINKTFSPSRPWKCPGCGAMKIRKNGRHTRLLYDLRFGAGSVRRWVTKYVIDHYKCSTCNLHFPSDRYEWAKHLYGQSLLAYVIYSIIDMHIPQLKLVRSMHKLFGYPLNQSVVNRMKERATVLYQGTHDEIRETLLKGRLVHADETYIGTKDGGGYVWVFTSMEEVVYLWSPTREADVATEFLKNFKGVLVSDFYSAYDALNCAQQKCLVHLIRDLNADILKEPFNGEMKAIASEFAALLKAIVATVDRFGLKRRFLSRHKEEVTRFYDRLMAQRFETETAKKVQDRFKRNHGRLFTFLEHDGVPWNNNNAEHAIKAFAGIRKVIEGLSNEKGIREYLLLLSISQTCTYRGLDFLDFLRSGEDSVDAYARRTGQ